MFILLLSVLILIVLLLIAHYEYSFRYWKRRKIPYVQPRIPWGNYTNVFERKIHFGQAIGQMYRQMKAQGHRYFGIYLFSSPCLVPVDPKLIRLVLAKDYQYFHDRNLFYNEKDDPISAHLMSLNGEKWKTLRSKLTPTFTTGKIKMLFKIFLECGQLLEDALKEHCRNNTPFHAKDMFASFSIDVIVNCAFGLEVNRVRKSLFYRYTKIALEFDVTRCIVMYLGAAFPNICRKMGFRQVAKSAGDFFTDIVKNTVKYREDTNTVRNDFLQLLINIKNEKIDGEKEFTDEEIAAQCFIFFLAGYETSASTMSFALYEIASNKDIYDKVMNEIETTLEKYDGEITYDGLQEMVYLNQVIDETLRKYSPAYTVSRTCTKDYKIPDTDDIIEKGTQVIIPIRGLHLDPEFYPDPEKFDPERFSSSNKKQGEQYTYLPFGGGPRNCIGRRFGYLETKTALIIALRKLKYTVASKTIIPFQTNPTALLYEVKGGIWLNCHQK